MNIHITLLFFFIVNLYAGNGTTEVKQTYRFDNLPDGGVYKLFMKNISGNLDITGHEGRGALITIKRITFEIRKEDIPTIHKKASVTVTHLEDQNLINIMGDNTNSSSQFIETFIHLELPKHINLDFQILGGDITLNKIRGESILNTLGGNIIIKNSKGKIDAKTHGGSINITNNEGILRAHSFGGNIKIVNSSSEIYSSTIGGDIVLDDINGNINCQSSGGSIKITNIEGNKISCRSSGGNINGEYLNGEIKLKSFGGDINLSNISGKIDLYLTGGKMEIKKAQSSIICKADKGNIYLSDMVGAIDAFTTSGNIDLDLIYDSTIKGYSINLETHSGNITANIPKNFPASIENIVYQTTSTKTINSEIALKINVEGNKVIGTRTIAGGTIPFALKSHHGSITIKEH